jgi:hypothetical protein
MILLNILSAISLAFLIKELNGPFDIFINLRSKLLSNKHVGGFFYSLFDCYYCLTFHTSYIMSMVIYPLDSLNARLILATAFASAMCSLVVVSFIQKVGK